MENHAGLRLGGWINAIIPVLIVPYYSVIGGWVLKYLVEYVRDDMRSQLQKMVIFLHLSQMDFPRKYAL